MKFAMLCAVSASLLLGCAENSQTDSKLLEEASGSINSNVSYKEYYKVNPDPDWIVVNMPNHLNAFNVFPGKESKGLYGKCNIQFSADVYAVNPTEQSKSITVSKAKKSVALIYRAAGFSENEIIITNQSPIDLNNLKGYFFEGSPANDKDNLENELKTEHYVLFNPDDIGVLYATVISLDNQTSDACFTGARKTINSISYIAGKDVY